MFRSRPSPYVSGAVLLTVVIVLGLFISLATRNDRARADSPIYHCAAIRDRKVCNISAEVGSGTQESEWIGRFAACAPQTVVASTPITYNGYTERIIVWCSR